MFSMNDSLAITTKQSPAVPAFCGTRQHGGQYRQQQNAGPEEIFLRAGVLCLFVCNLQPCQRKINTHLNQFVAGTACSGCNCLQLFNRSIRKTHRRDRGFSYGGLIVFSITGFSAVNKNVLENISKTCPVMFLPLFLPFLRMVKLA